MDAPLWMGGGGVRYFPRTRKNWKSAWREGLKRKGGAKLLLSPRVEESGLFEGKCQNSCF